MSAAGDFQYFISYSGVKLPLKLVNPIAPADLTNRNTFFRARFDDAGRLVFCEKLVYGETEMSHTYDYHPNGALRRAEIVMLDEETVMTYDEAGQPLPA